MGIYEERGELIKPKRKPFSQRSPQADSKSDRQVELLYALGGLSHGSNVSGVECYNPLDHEWKVLGSVSRHRSGGGVASLKGSIYVVGGHDGVVCLSSVGRYEPETNSWKRDVAPISEAKQDVAVAELGGYLYCVGGYDGLLCLSTVERYDPVLNRWCRVAPMNRRRRGLGLAVLDGYLYAVGGSDGCSPLYSVERYNPTEDRWTPCSPLRTCRQYLGCATFQGKIYAVGGRDDLTELRSVERFDPVANEWSAVMPMKSKRSKVSLAVANGYLLAIGGYDGTVHVTTVEAFDVEMNKWRRFGNTQTCHPGGGVTAIKMAPYDRGTSQVGVSTTLYLQSELVLPPFSLWDLTTLFFTMCAHEVGFTHVGDLDVYVAVLYGRGLVIVAPDICLHLWRASSEVYLCKTEPSADTDH